MLYAPALALSAVTGLHFEGAVIGIGDYVRMIMTTTTTTTTLLPQEQIVNNDKDLVPIKENRTREI